MLTIDGSFGEGGGQILRSSLALSMLTSTPIKVEKVRARRRKPGLMRQHLTALRAAARVSNAKVTGDRIASTEFVFEPQEIQSGTYEFSVGTAGSTTLVCQTVLPALMLAKGPSRIVFEGGTHNPLAPSFDFLARAYLPLIEKMGPRLTASLERSGFYPAGGGRFSIEVEPVDRLTPLSILERGDFSRRRLVAMVSSLDRSIADREIRVLRSKLNWHKASYEVIEVEEPRGPGNIVFAELESDHVCEVICALGEKFLPAESVANKLVSQIRKYVKSKGTVGEYLTDQLILPMALAGGGSILSTGLSLHATTHIDLVERFLGCRFETEQADRSVRVSLAGR